MGQTSGRDLSGAGGVPADKGKKDEEKLEGIVGRVAQALPGLQHWHLGDYEDANIPSRDVKWEKSGGWMEYVMQRSEGKEASGGGEGTGAAENEGRRESAEEAIVGVDNAAAGEVPGEDEIMLVAEGMVVEAIDKLWHTEGRK